MFAEMLKPARSWLRGRKVAEIACMANVEFCAEKSALCFSSLGREVEVDWPELTVSPELEGWHQLVILHCLHLADGTPLSGKWIPFASMKDGMIRGGGFDRQSAQELGRVLKDCSEEEILAAAQAMGGYAVESNADVSVVLPFLPRFPVLLKAWMAEEEDDLELSARMLIDGAADHYLTVEDAVTVGSIVLERMKARLGC